MRVALVLAAWLWGAADVDAVTRAPAAGKAWRVYDGTAPVPSASDNKPTVSLSASLGSGSSLTMSPTPLLSAFGSLTGAFEVDTPAPTSDSEFLPNAAINKTCVLSSSPRAQGTFCRLSEEASQLLMTASEENPFMIFDLGKLHFVDHVSFTTPRKQNESPVNVKLLVQCLDKANQEMTRTEASTKIPAAWSKIALMDEVYSFHVHSACALIRLQRLSFGPLAVQDLKIFGAPIKNPQILGCISGHNAEMCAGNGVCENGTCSCRFGFSGSKCEEHALVDWETIQLAVVASALSTVAIVVYTVAHKRQVRAAVLDARKSLLLHADDQKITRSLSGESLGSYEPPSAKGELSYPETSRSDRGSLHLLFASPLVIVDPLSKSVRPMQALNIQREHSLLERSLQSGMSNIPLTVSVATCDELHRIMTVGNVSCLHFSGHCTPDFLAFEDGSGSLHQIKMSALRALLRSTVTARSLETLRMVVLSACKSERAALEFVLAGVPHVVAYRTQVRDSTASVFTQALYLALSCGRTVRDAFDSAKEAVRSSPFGADREEMDGFVLLPEDADHREIIWSVSDDGPNSYPADHDSSWPVLSGMRPLPPVTDDPIGRHADMWRVVEAFTPRSGPRSNLVIVHGGAGIGKSHLTRSVAQHFHMRRSGSVFPDGIFYVKHQRERGTTRGDLADLAILVNELAKSLSPLVENNMVGAPLDADSTLKQVEARCVFLADSLNKCNCLIVFDGVEQTSLLIELLVARLLEAPRVRLLVTCRELFSCPLDTKCAVIQLHPLRDRDAAILLARQLQNKVLLEDNKELSLQQLSEHSLVTSAKGNPYSIIKSALELGKSAGPNGVITFSAPATC